MMRILVCLVLPLAVWCAPAALKADDSIPEDSLKPLIRTKRAQEEIVFGNHQNNKEEVVKKSDTSLQNDNEEAVIDNKEDAIDAATENTGNDAVEKADDVSTDDVSTDQEESSDNDVEEAPGNDSDVAESLEDLLKGEDAEVPDKETENKLDEESSEEEISKDDDNDVEDQEPEFLYPKPNEYPMRYDYNYLQYLRSQDGLYRQRRNTKEKRSSAPLMTAENMQAGEPSQSRVKRDLTADDIYDWLQNGQQQQTSYPEYDTEDVEDDSWKDQDLSELLNEYSDGQDNNAIDYPAPEEYGDTDDPKDLLSLLEYLVEIESPKQESPLSELYPDDIQEEWQDFDAANNVEYEPIIYNGIPGIFIPVAQQQTAEKRQYLSMVPGVRKRNFYPYSLEPEGGRWGAFVNDQEEKRTADAYERLYRMAQALNPSEDAYRQEFEYK